MFQLSSTLCSIAIFCHLSELLLSFSVSVCLQVKSVCLSLQDSNVLVQRNMLEILLYFFPFAECLVGTHKNTLPFCLLGFDMPSMNRWRTHGQNLIKCGSAVLFVSVWGHEKV